MSNIFSYIILSSLLVIGVSGIGLNYGLLGNDLPAPSDVVSLLQSKNVNRIRIFGTAQNVLKAIQGSGIEVILTANNQDLGNLGDLSFAQTWVSDNIVPYVGSIRYISAGNEMIPGEYAGTVLPAMENIHTALKSLNLDIPVTTAVSTDVFTNTYPPSQGVFKDSVSSTMTSITRFLVENNSPLLVNVYPYFSYIDPQANIPLDYALFRSGEVVVQDGSFGYTNLFDAILDSAYAALETAGGSNVKIVVAETGWPSAENGNFATIENARIYNNNLIKHVSGTSGSPRRQGTQIETYIFAIFNENQKPAGTEQHFGLFYPDKTEVYPVNFNP